MAFTNSELAHPIYRLRGYPVERDPVILFIEEIINFSLRSHYLPSWTPPVNLFVARAMNRHIYFDESFGERVVDAPTEAEAVRLAESFSFDGNRWLRFDDMELASRYIQYFLLEIFNHENVHRDAAFFRTLSFACYASRRALRRYQNRLVNVVVWALYAVRGVIFPADEEYFRRMYFANNLPGIQYPDDDQPHDADEGIVANIPRVTERSVFHVDPILLFVEEFIDYMLSYNNIEGWIPVIDLEYLRRVELPYFTVDIGAAILQYNEDYSEDMVHTARALGFTEEIWLSLTTNSEARRYQCYFLRHMLSFHSDIEMLLFAYYSSRLALGLNRNAFVNQVVSALVEILRQNFPAESHYRELQDWATRFNSLDDCDDSAVSAGSEGGENPDCQSLIAENKTSEHAESYHQSSTGQNKAEIPSVSNASEEKTGDRTLEEASESDTLVKKSHSDEKKNEIEEGESKVGNAASESDDSEGKSGYEGSAEASESDVSEGKSGRKTLKKSRKLRNLKDECESDTSEVETHSDATQTETEESNSETSELNFTNKVSEPNGLKGKGEYESSDDSEGKSGRAEKKTRGMEIQEEESESDTSEYR